MQNNRYEQPKLQLVSLALNDVLLASAGDAYDPAGELDTNYQVKLDAKSWKSIWN